MSETNYGYWLALGAGVAAQIIDKAFPEAPRQLYWLLLALCACAMLYGLYGTARQIMSLSAVRRWIDCSEDYLGVEFNKRARLRQERVERELMERMATRDPIVIGGYVSTPMPTADISIAEVFEHIEPGVMREFDRQQVVGQQIRDALSLGRLSAWGRPLGDASYYAPAAGCSMPTPELILPFYWQKADFSYTFFDATRRFGKPDTVFERENIKPTSYFDLKLSRQEMLSVWPPSADAVVTQKLKVIAIRFADRLSAQPPYPDAKAILMSREAQHVKEQSQARAALKPLSEALFESARRLVGNYEVLWVRAKVRKTDAEGRSVYEYEWRYTNDPDVLAEILKNRLALGEAAQAIAKLRD